MPMGGGRAESRNPGGDCREGREDIDASHTQRSAEAGPQGPQPPLLTESTGGHAMGSSAQEQRRAHVGTGTRVRAGTERWWCQCLSRVLCLAPWPWPVLGRMKRSPQA